MRRFRWYHYWMLGHSIYGPTLGNGYMYFRCSCGAGWIE